MSTDESRQERAARYVRTLVAYAKRDDIYSLGLEIGGEHADVICVRVRMELCEDTLIPIARLLVPNEIAALTEAFSLESSNARRH